MCFVIFLLNDFRNVTRGEEEIWTANATSGAVSELGTHILWAAPESSIAFTTVPILAHFFVVFQRDMHIQHNNKSFEGIPSQPNEMTSQQLQQLCRRLPQYITRKNCKDTNETAEIQR